MTTDERERTVRVSVPEMDCPSCAGKVTASVERLDGVRATDPAPTTGTLRVEYDADETDAAAIRERVEAAGYAVEDDSESAGNELRLSVPEMDCPSCAGKVENALGGIAGVESFETSPATGEVLVTGDADREEVVAAIEGAGYEVVNAEADDDGPDVAAPSEVWTSSRALKTWTGGALIVVGLLLEFFLTSADALLLSAVGREFHLSS